MESRTTRRDFIRAAAALGANFAIPGVIQKALAIPANNATGTIADVEHVVIFMQENRSFDHYFGSLAGVRGFGDPRALTLPSGQPVWQQPNGSNGDYVLPYHFDLKNTNAAHIGLDHSWKGTQDAWSNWDAWVTKKSPKTMGYFDRGDLPFYYALADAFTICDAYHCSVFGPTDPNRFYAMSGKAGTNITGLNQGSLYNTVPKYNGDPSRDDISATTIAGAPDWVTYAEVLEANKVSWKAYQEFDNYGDNYFAYFKQFRVESDGTRLKPTSPLYIKGRTVVDGSTAQNTAGTKGDLLVQAFKRDIDGVNGVTALPKVSWIFAPYEYTEHPSATPSAGEDLTSRLLAALASNPEVWSKTVFVINYDENDGCFDHVPANVPPINSDKGFTTLADATVGEVYNHEPIGLGPRVPMLLISPWSKGGRVCSQLFDHTSVLRFIEEWLVVGKGLSREKVSCTNISPWRRAICGDLTSAFDFKSPNKDWPTVVPAATYQNVVGPRDAAPPIPQVLATQESNCDPRPACPLPYQFFADFSASAVGEQRDTALSFGNTGNAGVAFIVYSNGRSGGAWHYAVEARKSLNETKITSWRPLQYDLRVHGPNGFFRDIRGSFTATGGAAPEVRVRDDYERAAIVLTLLNEAGAKPCTFSVQDNLHAGTAKSITVAAGKTYRLLVTLADAKGWYDLSVTADTDAGYLRRVAGHVESAGPAWTDPHMGTVIAAKIPQAPAPLPPGQAPTLATATPSIKQGTKITFDYSVPAAQRSDTNWVSIFPQTTVIPDSPAYRIYSLYTYAKLASGKVEVDTSKLAAGSYKAFFLANDGYVLLVANPVVFTITA